MHSAKPASKSVPCSEENHAEITTPVSTSLDGVKARYALGPSTSLHVDAGCVSGFTGAGISACSRDARRA